MLTLLGVALLIAVGVGWFFIQRNETKVSYGDPKRAANAVKFCNMASQTNAGDAIEMARSQGLRRGDRLIRWSMPGHSGP